MAIKLYTHNRENYEPTSMGQDRAIGQWLIETIAHNYGLPSGNLT